VTALSNATTDIVVVVIALGLMVFIHELGHFVAAKWMGVRVLTFSFGFGKRLFGWKQGRFSFGRLAEQDPGTTDYRVSLLPLGGYVKMAGEDPSQPQTGDPGDYLSHPRWQRFVIVVMGPAMNILLAVLLLTGLFRYHFEEPAWEQQAARIGEVATDSPAARAGLQPGDLITRLGEVANPKWADVEVKVAISPGEALPVEILRDGESRQLEVTPRPEGRDQLGYAGWAPCVPALLGMIESGSPASHAGLKPGDRITALDGRPILCWQDLAPALEAGKGKTAELTVLRAGQSLPIQITPSFGDVMGQKKWHIGVSLRDVVVRQLGWSKAFQSAINENIRTCALTFNALGKILTRQMSPRSLSGPIGIAQMSGAAYRAGITELLSVSAGISLELGIFNLLPIPILDGGVILLLLIEAVIRRDLSMAMKERVVQVGLALLLLLTVFVMYNDLVKTFKPY
jgi:regulator of sigma E protease